MTSDHQPLFLPDTAATAAAGARLAADLRAGDVLALTGGLGAGKTHLSKGIVHALGCPADVTSPTFSLVHEYHGGRLSVFHFDFYRIGSAQEVAALGWDDYLDARGICLVEWADLFPSLLPPATQWWSLQPHEAGRRLLRSSPPLPLTVQSARVLTEDRLQQPEDMPRAVSERAYI